MRGKISVSTRTAIAAVSSAAASPSAEQMLAATSGRWPEMSFDISETLAPKSDQMDAVDLLGGPQTFTVTEVTRGNAEQPVQIALAEFP